MLFNRYIFLFLLWHLSNSIWNTSISGVKFSWTTLQLPWSRRFDGVAVAPQLFQVTLELSVGARQEEQVQPVDRVVLQVFQDVLLPLLLLRLNVVNDRMLAMAWFRPICGQKFHQAFCRKLQFWPKITLLKSYILFGRKLSWSRRLRLLAVSSVGTEDDSRDGSWSRCAQRLNSCLSSSLWRVAIQ